jgi:hypothetical protein
MTCTLTELQPLYFKKLLDRPSVRVPLHPRPVSEAVPPRVAEILITPLEVRKAADQRWSRVELGCCGDLSSVPLAFALVVSKEEDRRWFFA